jgi:hypothetical protein
MERPDRGGANTSLDQSGGPLGEKEPASMSGASTGGLAREREASTGGVGERARDLDKEAGREAADRGEELADQARELGHQVEEAAISRAEEGRHRLAEGVHKLSEALRIGAREIREGDDDVTTEFVERLAEPVDRFSEYLERHDTRELAHNLEHFARRNQGLFLGGAFALGMLGARFLKSSPRSQQLSDVRGDWHAGGREEFERGGYPRYQASGHPGDLGSRDVRRP